MVQLLSLLYFDPAAASAVDALSRRSTGPVLPRASRAKEVRLGIHSKFDVPTLISTLFEIENIQ